MSGTGWTPEDLEQVAQRAVDVADEAFGPFPVQTPAEAMTAIEKGIFEQRQSGEAARTEIDARIDGARIASEEIDRLARLRDRLAFAIREVASHPGGDGDEPIPWCGICDRSIEVCDRFTRQINQVHRPCPGRALRAGYDREVAAGNLAPRAS